MSTKKRPQRPAPGANVLAKPPAAPPAPKPDAPPKPPTLDESLAKHTAELEETRHQIRGVQADMQKGQEVLQHLAAKELQLMGAVSAMRGCGAKLPGEEQANG